MVKPGILSKKRLKKIEDDLRVERNKLELAFKNRVRASGDQAEEGDEVIEKWDAELEELTAKLRGLREKTVQPKVVRGFGTELEEKEAVIGELRSALEISKLDLEENERRRSDLESEIKSLRKENIAETSELRSNLKTTEGELKSLRRDLEDSLKTNSTVEQRNERDVGGLRDDIVKLEHEVGLNEDELLKKEGRIKELEQILKSMQNELQGLGRKRTELKSESEKTMEKIEAETNKMRVELETKSGELQNLKDRFDRTQADLKESINARRDEARAFKGQISSLEAEAKNRDKNLRKEIAHKEKLNVDLQQTEAELRETLKLKKSFEAQSREIKKRQENEIMVLSKRLSVKEAEISSLKERLEVWHETIRIELDSAIEHITRQSEEINSLQAKLEVKEAKLRKRDELYSYKKRSNPY
jgi:chromosome segregation ATPase